MLGICSTIGKSHMKRSVFKHGHWAASRGLQSQGATTISILFRPKPWSMFLTTSLSFESAFCNIFAVQKGNASFEHIFNPRWGSVLLLRSHLWIGVLLNMATELSPGDCKAKGPQRYPYCFRPKPRSIFLTTSLSFESAFCNISDVQQGECIIWTYLQSTLGICSTIGKSHMNRNVFTELPPGDCKAKEPQLYPYCFRPKPWCIFLTKSLSSESAFCNIFDVQKGNASFEHIFNQRWGSVVLLGSHLWLGILLNMATELPPGDCKAKK